MVYGIFWFNYLIFKKKIKKNFFKDFLKDNTDYSFEDFWSLVKKKKERKKEKENWTSNHPEGFCIFEIQPTPVDYAKITAKGKQ